MLKDWKIGQTVRFLNDSGQGRITEINWEKGVAMVEDETEFSFPHPLNELVLVENLGDEAKSYARAQQDVQEHFVRNTHENVINRVNKEFKMLYKNELASSERRRGEVMEVDLHIHHLMHSHDGMTNGEIVTIQLEHFERIMRIAVKDKIKKVVFIHGVGQGVLRSEIRRMLKSYYPQCEFQDANWQQYGQGATMVTF